ncbi:MAG TPA: methionyl-tRNA formyltransferase [Solirubrobacterales bacterium]|nr:methionyl-tRNA formyltransferase [Solirubrobacterales bacterium]
MRLAYLGTSDFAATVLRRLAAADMEPALVIAPPDRRQGRGRHLAPPPVAREAAELGLELHQTPSVNEPVSLRAISDAGIDLGLVCAFGQLVKSPLLDEIEMLNVHPSLLPRWRGAAPIERAIMAGDHETGVAIMRLEEGLDSGPVALSERVDIGKDEDFGSLSARLAELGGDLTVRALELREAGELKFAEQSSEGVTYAAKVEAEDRRLDPARSAVELANVTRALHPHIGAYLALEGGDRLGVTRAEAAPDGAAAGSLQSEEGALVLGTADGGLRILVVKPAGKREMSAADYLRGNPSPRLAH